MSSSPESSFVWESKNMCAGYSEIEGFISDINLKIGTGERVAIMGDNNGRAMLLRVFAGLRPVREGELTVFGTKLSQIPYYADWDQIMSQSMRRRLGVCLEEPGLLSNVSIREGLELLFRFKYGDHTEKLREGAAKVVRATCLRFELGSVMEKRPVMLTPAERRLGGLARAFLSKPPVVLLENPTLSINDSMRDTLWSALAHMGEQAERTLIISTDNWLLAHSFCTRWIVFEKDKISFDGTPKQFLKSQHPLLEGVRALRKVQESHENLLKELA